MDSKGDILEIMNLLPHRYPLLLVDKILEFEEGKSIICIKNVSFNEPFFNGHFPGYPVMPGVLIVEALAQAAALYVIEDLQIDNSNNNMSVYLMSIENAKFRQIVTPGDTLYLHVKKERSRANVWKFNGEAKVNNKLVAESSFTAMIAGQ